jgi:hypothetical protein
MSEQRTPAVLRAESLLVWALTALLFYALDRGYKAATSPPFDPVGIIATARIDYFWRMALSAFIGTFAMMAWPRIAAGREERAAALLLRVAPWVIVFSAILMVVFA